MKPPTPTPLLPPSVTTDMLRNNGVCGRVLVFAIGVGFCGKQINHDGGCGR